MNGFYKHHFIFIFPGIIILFLLGVSVQFFFQMTAPITMHLGFIPVFAQLFCDKSLVHLELHYDKALAEILQQQPQENAYHREPFHAANLVNNYQSGIHYNGFIVR